MHSYLCGKPLVYKKPFLNRSDIAAIQPLHLNGDNKIAENNRPTILVPTVGKFDSKVNKKKLDIQQQFSFLDKKNLDLKPED